MFRKPKHLCPSLPSRARLLCRTHVERSRTINIFDGAAEVFRLRPARTTVPLLQVKEPLFCPYDDERDYGGEEAD